MKISIGQRLFASVLLAILAVAAGAVFLLRQNVLASFGDYAAGIELDRLDELSTDLQRRYRHDRGWDFIPAAGRAGWIVRELARLQRARDSGIAPLPPPPMPAQPPAPGAPVHAGTHAGTHIDAPRRPDMQADSDSGTDTGTATDPATAASAPPAPPHAPAAPVVPAPAAAPALPAVPVPPLPPPAPPLAPVAPGPAIAAGDPELPLASRITLFDAAGRYVAGHAQNGLPPARRALDVDGRTIGWLGVARGARPSDAMAYAFLAQLRASLWLIALGAVALSALAATLLARHFRRPIRALAQGAARLSAGRFDVRLDATRSDELGDLARHFDTLARQLAAAEGARRQWVADTSHELRTPLAVLRAQLEAVQDGVRSATPETLASMLRQVLALNKLIDELYALARADVGALECRGARIDLWRLACDQATGFEARLQAAGLTLDLGPAPAAATVLADADRMRQVLDNLFENSLRYTQAGGRLRLQASIDAGRLLLVLDDSAPGVPDTLLARLGERFFRVDASRSRAHGGAGLGLALCRRLLDAQGATLGFAASPLGGLRVTIAMPLATEDA